MSKKQPKREMPEKVVFQPLSTTEITNYFADEVLSWMQYDHENADGLMKVIASLWKETNDNGEAHTNATLYLIAEKVYVHTTHGADSFREFSKQNGFFE